MPFCAEHGIRVHPSSPTFVYYNGATEADKRRANLRNIVFEKEFFAAKILGNAAKAESHRFGSEKSEDALTWNVFAGLLALGKLPELYVWVTGKPLPETVELYLWGLRIDLGSKEPATLYGPLCKVRDALERDIRRYKTEPDVILVGPDRLLCIEAKFTSGNPLAHDADAKPGEKPTRREELLRRYLEGNQCWRTPAIGPHEIGETLHSQLFRIAVFAACMAEPLGLAWQVVNLVSETQWRRRGRGGREDRSDPTPSLPPSIRERFQLRTWEALHALVAEDDGMASVREYLDQKSAFLEPAFR